MACRAKENDKVLRRGEPSIEWYKDGKPQYYCYGYIEKMSDELLPECKECRSHVSKAQDDLDEYNRRMQIMNEEKNYPPYLDYPKPYRPITNADRIRSMSDEELAELLCCTGWRLPERKECLEWLRSTEGGEFHDE